MSVDEIGSARTATRHLIDRGRSRLAMITGPPDTPGGRYRVVGFREELGEAFDPPLTTMRQPFGAISATMVRLLLDLVDGRAAASETLPTELIVRHTS